MILVLGGTVEGRVLAGRLHEQGHEVLLSLGGRTREPLLPRGVSVRSGGFGGAEGLAALLRQGQVELVVDATHPFATAMTRNAAMACAASSVGLLRLERPSWREHPAARTWAWVEDHQQAAARARELGTRVLLTVGRQHTLDYAPVLGDRFVLARVAETVEGAVPGGELPPAWTLLQDRGPFTLEAERRLLADHDIDVLVTKDAGGSATAAKLDAAQERGVRVVALRRPPLPAGLDVVSSVDAAVAVVEQVVSGHGRSSAGDRPSAAT